MRRTSKAAITVCFTAVGLLVGLNTSKIAEASTWVPDTGASDLTTVQTCSGTSTGTGLAPRSIKTSGAGSGGWAVSIGKNTSRVLTSYSPSGSPHNTSWASGTWTVQVDVTSATTSTSTLAWTASCIIRVNSSGVAQLTEGTGTGSILLNTTGTKSMTVTQSSTDSSASATDRLAVVLKFVGDNSSQSFTLETGNGSNEFIAGPLIDNPGGGLMPQLLMLGVGDLLFPRWFVLPPWMLRG